MRLRWNGGRPRVVRCISALDGLVVLVAGWCCVRLVGRSSDGADAADHASCWVLCRALCRSSILPQGVDPPDLIVTFESEKKMTTMFPRGPAATALPMLPDGWPVGSYDTYLEAQRAVDQLADHGFPVQGVTIVGIEPMLVERVDARLTWRSVLAGGAASGAWLGLFVGVLLSLFTASGGVLPIGIGLVCGVGFGVASAAVRYASSKGQRGFVSHSQLVARRYDVLCPPRSAERARDLLAVLAMRTG